MEQRPRHPEEGGNERPPAADDAASLELDAARREQLIEEGIEIAAAADTVADDWTIRHIALQLSEQSGSALDVLAQTGEITAGVRYELLRDYEQQPAARQRWIDCLGTYAVNRPDTGPVAGWTERAAVRDRFDAAWRAIRSRSVRTAESRRCDNEVAHRRQATQLISNALAMRMLVLLAPSPHSALARFAADGTVTDALSQELAATYEQGNARARGWIDQLGPWIIAKTGTSPIPDRWPVPGETAQPDAASRTEAADEVARGTDTATAPSRAERLAQLEADLASLPDLGDIPSPEPGRPAESGYDWMERLPHGWQVEPSWGRDGWDLGAWPLIVVALFIDERHDRYAVATYTEGDVTAHRYATRGALYVAVNELAEFHWRIGQSLGPTDLPEESGLLAKHCGPFSQHRLEREIAAERARQRRPDASGNANGRHSQ